MSNFQLPACNLFREKLVEGQVCYEADINRFNDTEWGVNLQKGFSFVIDLNGEYDVRNLLTRSTSADKEKSGSVTLYKQTEKDNRVKIRLNTISNHFLAFSMGIGYTFIEVS